MKPPFSSFLCCAAVAIATSTTSAPASAAEPGDAGEPSLPASSSSSSSSPATGAPASPSPFTFERAEASSSQKYWYGWQTLIADGASLTILMAGAKSDGLGYVGLGGYLLGGPVVHIANHNYAAAIGSLVMRPVLPIVGGYLGYASAGTCTEKRDSGFLGNCFLHGLGETILGVAIGASIAITVDAAVLARGERAVEKPKYDGKLKVTDVSPTYDPKTGTAGFGLSGSF